MTAYEAALETARLVKMLDYEDQLWNPPGQEHGRLTEFDDQIQQPTIASGQNIVSDSAV
jgi:hypothetical protein